MCDVVMVTFFGDVMVTTTQKYSHNLFLKFDFVI